MQPKEPSHHVFRDLIEEQRDRYTVSYQPADARSSLAILSLFFPEAPRDRSVVVSAMETELEKWLKRYPVPVRVSPYNARKRLIRHSPNTSDCHLTGYVRLLDDAVIRRWGAMDEAAIPAETYEPEHLAEAYKDIPYRIRDEDRAMAKIQFRYRVKAICVALLFALVFPALLQAVVYWGQELALPLLLVSAAVGAYKGTGIMGWRKPSRREQRRADLIALKEHYFYHCEKNPGTFARLEKENVKREVNRESKEGKRLLQRVAVRTKKPRGSWMFIPRLFRGSLARSQLETAN
jgi:hypothetical protein